MMFEEEKCVILYNHLMKYLKITVIRKVPYVQKCCAYSRLEIKMKGQKNMNFGIKNI